MEESFYAQLFRELAVRNVRYVLCGGLAIVLHKLRRFTHDADLAVDFEPPNILCLVEAMKTLGLAPYVPVDPEELGDPARRREWREEKNAVSFSPSMIAR